MLSFSSPWFSTTSTTISSSSPPPPPLPSLSSFYHHCELCSASLPILDYHTLVNMYTYLSKLIIIMFDCSYKNFPSPLFISIVYRFPQHFSFFIIYFSTHVWKYNESCIKVFPTTLLFITGIYGSFFFIMDETIIETKFVWKIILFKEP